MSIPHNNRSPAHKHPHPQQVVGPTDEREQCRGGRAVHDHIGHALAAQRLSSRVAHPRLLGQLQRGYVRACAVAIPAAVFLSTRASVSER
jgi:hypothetical protein